MKKKKKKPNICKKCGKDKSTHLFLFVGGKGPVSEMCSHWTGKHPRVIY